MGSAPVALCGRAAAWSAYVPEFLHLDEEQKLLSEIERLAFEPVRMHGPEARRQVVHFGTRYQFDNWRRGSCSSDRGLFAEPLYRRAAAEADFRRTPWRQALVTRYPQGAAIGWHRDAPPFGTTVVGISLGAACEVRFRLPTDAGYNVYEQELGPRPL